MQWSRRWKNQPCKGQQGYPGKEQTNAVQAKANSGAIGTVEDHRSALSRITKDQVQKLVSLIEAPKDA